MDAEFEDDDTYGGDQLIPGAARSNLRNPGDKDDASILYNNNIHYSIKIFLKKSMLY